MVGFGSIGSFCVFMKLRLLSWNVRGLNNPQKRESIKYWLRSWKCDVVCLQETKLDQVDLQMVRSLWGSPFVEWEFLPASGSAGGVLMLWDNRVLEKVDSVVNQFSVSCLWKGVSDGLNGLARVSMVRQMIFSVGSYGRS
jgi:hypothetical protein